MLPTIVFILTIAIFMRMGSAQIAKNTEEISVLGDRDDLDSKVK